jgi:sulfite exporter TauE/SafE
VNRTHHYSTGLLQTSESFLPCGAVFTILLSAAGSGSEKRELMVVKVIIFAIRIKL